MYKTTKSNKFKWIKIKKTNLIGIKHNKIISVFALKNIASDLR